ncbi:DUF3859 domain-containing protein [Shewanella sp. A3A]|uniref:DUF3859 domain-containing protein n=1 Tax=Shewanella electrica TaxID=515560 RepID=A0ABT2FMG0_9GAMM|nr:DUF3859 domain-containing protein [Shewanella electrica]MCH1921351.1 DUF3859 domain-containing protein [Shewanella ferrihydritica]MCH1926121.1 DUF3859 domain-containing protein [Shewanella electrica]MCS4557510.1 DUF3859 domain-containing protein [Shewanella electrica]
MSKLKPDVTVLQSGIFSKWDEDSKELPKFLQATVHIPAELDIEFGFVARIRKAKNQLMRYCIYHPDITDDEGEVMAPFDGEVYVESNDWKFFLGDTIWAPLANKVGRWRMTLEIRGQVVAEQSFKVHYRDEEEQIGNFWKRRGF